MGPKAKQQTAVSSARHSRSSPKALDFSQMTALYICAMHKGEAAALLENFAPAQAKRSQSFATLVNSWDSATRQGRITRELGVRVDGVERLKRLIVDAPPLLRRAIGQALPAALKPQFPHIQNSETPIAPALMQLAHRLLKEALR